MGSFEYQYRYNQPEDNRQNSNTDNDMSEAVILQVETLRKYERYFFVVKNGVIKSSDANVQIKVDGGLEVSKGSRIELIINGQKVEQAKVTLLEVVQLSDTVFNSYSNAAEIISVARLNRNMPGNIDTSAISETIRESRHRKNAGPVAKFATERPAGPGKPIRKPKGTDNVNGNGGGKRK